MMKISEMSKEDIIFQLLLRINAGKTYYPTGENDCVWLAIRQYNRLVEKGIIKCEEDEE